MKRRALTSGILLWSRYTLILLVCLSRLLISPSCLFNQSVRFSFFYFLFFLKYQFLSSDYLLHMRFEKVHIFLLLYCNCIIYSLKYHSNIDFCVLSWSLPRPILSWILKNLRPHTLCQIGIKTRTWFKMRKLLEIHSVAPLASRNFHKHANIRNKKAHIGKLIKYNIFW